MDFTEEELRRAFQALGAEDVEDWVTSQLREGIPQLHRFLFLQKAWSSIPDERNHAWIDYVIAAAERRPDDPYAGAGHALRRLRALGAADEDLTELVRAQMAELLFSICYLMEDPGYMSDERQRLPDLLPTLDRVNWGFFALDEDDRPIQPVGGLHESVLETDPTGREATPPPSRTEPS